MQERRVPEIALLTAGRDKPYALGIAGAFLEAGIAFEFLGSDEIDAPFLHGDSRVIFHNMRGDQTENATLPIKIARVLRYYSRLLTYAVKARPRVFHILWNNKFEWFDRTLLMAFYRVCGRRIVLTAHNVNIHDRDGTDSFMNRWTLRVQYRLSDAIFVHTAKMGADLQQTFDVPADKVKVIPFPINSTPRNTSLTGSEARAKLELSTEERVLLVYGQIARYKGIEHLVQALSLLGERGFRCRVVIAGRVKKNADEYWAGVQESIQRLNVASSILARIEFISDDDTEIFFKAADALVLPYTYIFQSGVLFLSYNFGLPVLVADLGTLKESIVEGETGFVFRSKDAVDLADVIQRYFDSALYRELSQRRQKIREFALENYSWSRVVNVTAEVYRQLLNGERERVLAEP